ncbi:MAG TPA: FecR family protein [Candidatus Dormibacteraeota bacterium]|nr:FecR family protein [Candidatus Dormibacteraeota bacterium]
MAQPTPGLGAPPPAKRRRGGCLGCLIPLLVIILLLGGAFYFLVVQAAAAVSVPAQLVVLNPNTTLTHSGSAQPGKSGALVNAGDSIRNDANGRSLIQFQDGSITRLAPSSQVTLQSADFDQQGRLHNVSIVQEAGRSFSTVQKLVAGNAHFSVAGHAANASVRGTRFEIIQNPDGSFLLKVYVGLVALNGSNGSTVSVPAGQQAGASAGGAVSKPVPIVADPSDPFTLWISSEEAAKAAGQPATAQTSFDQAAIATGQTSTQPEYDTAGGEVIGELAYPGSNMELDVTDPNGTVHAASGGTHGPNGKLVVVDIPYGPGGAYKVSVKGLDVNPAEHFAVTLITKFACAANQVVAGGFVRNVLSANQTRDALVQAGGIQVSVSFRGASAGGANLGGSGSFAGTSIAAGALVYAAGGGNVGVILTEATVDGINVRGQITGAMAQATGHNLSSLNIGYEVDRIYTCSSGTDDFLVIEGRPPAGG